MHKLLMRKLSQSRTAENITHHPTWVHFGWAGRSCWAVGVAHGDVNQLQSCFLGPTLRIVGSLNSWSEPRLMSFSDFAVITLFHCLWKNRQDADEPRCKHNGTYAIFGIIFQWETSDLKDAPSFLELKSVDINCTLGFSLLGSVSEWIPSSLFQGQSLCREAVQHLSFGVHL